MKPAAWNVDALHTDLPNVWRGLNFLAAFWEGAGGTVFDLSRRGVDLAFAGSGSGPWIATRHGRSIELLGATSDRLEATVASGHVLPGVSAFPVTMLYVETWTDAAQHTRGLSIADSSADNISRSFYINKTTVKPTWEVRNTTLIALEGPTVSVGDLIVMVGVSRSATDHEFYVNGISAATSSTSAPWGTHDAISVGRVPRATPFYGEGTRPHLAAVWNRELAVGEIQCIAHDPFGLVRYVRPVPVYPHYSAKRR